MVDVDVITQEVIQARLDGIVREMEVAVLRTGFSTIIRESHDFSCGILDRQGRVIGQYSGLPPHLGAYPDCVKGVLQFYDMDEMEEGDCFLSNHPYYSGVPHPMDMVVVAPAFYDGEVVAFFASMGHKSDIGGVSPGSRNSQARDVFGEGLHILPVKFLSKGKRVKETEHFLTANSRTPHLVLGDLGAQAGALQTMGVQRLQDLMDTYGKDVVLSAFEHIASRTAERIRQEVASWPDGVTEMEGSIEDIVNPGVYIKLHVAVIKEGERVVLDFSASGDQSAGPINIRPPFARGVAYHAVLAVIDPSMPNNYALADTVECRFREGSILNPLFPAPVGYYSQTMPGVSTMVYSAVSQAAGRPIIAYSGQQCSTIISHMSEGSRPYVQYELLSPGGPAHDGGDGWSGSGHGWSGGAKFTSVEIVESEFDIKILNFEVAQDSGGPGKFRGGLGYRRDYLIQGNSKFTGGSARRPSSGVAGGDEGKLGYVFVNPGADGEQKYDHPVSGLSVGNGDVLRLEPGGGGGVGSPKERDRERVIEDLEAGFISAQAAKDVYGLADEVIAEVVGTS